MSEVRSADGVAFPAAAGVLIIGAGAAGLCAALAAAEAGAEAVVIERDPVSSGSTALSAGLIPAAGTRFQRSHGVDDTPAIFAADIARKCHGEADPALVATVARESADVVEWLADTYAFPFELISNFNYPGHSALRMHGLPGRTGAELIDRLRAAVEARGIPLLCGSTAETLFADATGRIHGIELVHGDGTRERIGCGALVLACNGYGGAPELVRRFIPEMADALYFGHAGNRGDAVRWGETLGARTAHLSGYQGHGSVATPHNILITWAVITEGGIQINTLGRRFSEETQGYSEQAASVLRQPGGIAFDIFDEHIAAIARQFPDFREAEWAGALVTAVTLDELAARLDVPLGALRSEFGEMEAAARCCEPDRFGRLFRTDKLPRPPYCAVKVTGALFHTQGGMAIDQQARVLRRDGTTFPNLFAAGGAAAGVSGSTAAGYLSGNGLLTATVFGRIAGQRAGSQSRPTLLEG
jgi:fumarate reductase flavoprotein subunit